MMGRQRLPYPVPEAQLRAELHTASDRQVARTYGVSVSVVGRWRARLGVVRHADRPPLWQHIVAQLQTVPEGLRQVDLARRCGVSRQAVQQVLKSLQTQGVVTVVAVANAPKRIPYWAYEQRWVAVQSPPAVLEEGESLLRTT